jgi:parvulin-like peptidyl-prolyl isomerase
MFETARDAFTGRRVRASHVLVSTEYARTDAEKAEARRKAERLRAGILAGADFAEVARAHSECPSRESGGDLGFISRRGQLVEEFARAAFALEPGEVSGVVESRVGFHVVKVTAEEKGRDVALDEVREEVTRAVVEDRTREILAELRAGARIVDPNAPGE